MRTRAARARVTLAMILLAGLAGCGGDSGTDPDDPVATAIAKVSGDGQSGAPGAELAAEIVVRVTDQDNQPMAGVLVTWVVVSGGGSISPSSATTDASGIARGRWTLGGAGNQSAEARVTGLQAADFNANLISEPPALESVAPDPIVAGQSAVLTGQNFNPTPAGNTVRFNGVNSVVTAASPTQLTVTVPCVATGPVTVQLSVGTQTTQVQHTALGGTTLDLQPGEAARFDDSPGTCKEIVGGGSYMIAIANGDDSINPVSVRVRGSSNTGVVAAPVTIATTPQRRARSAGLAARIPVLADWRENHVGSLERNQRLLEAATVAAAPPITASAAAGAPNVGDIISIKVPDLDGNLCSIEATISARVVFVSEHAIIAEDPASPAANQMDDLFAELGEEFEDVMLPIITQNFGDPFAARSLTDGDERLIMLFTPEVNQFSVGGFVSSGDFFPASGASSCTASNENEIFFGAAPTQAGGGLGAGALSPEVWQLIIRSIVIHEVKHIVGFAYRLLGAPANGPPNYEAIWIEEGAAVVAEELFARDVFGYEQNSNVDYMTSIFCEVRNVPQSGAPECLGFPQVMFDYWDFLHDYLQSTEARTPVGSSGGGDVTFYGSSWSLLRWITDEFGGNEAAFLSELTQQSTLRGGTHYETLTGVEFGELIADWVLSLYLDDQSGLPSLPVELNFASWNSPDIFAGLAADFPGTYNANPHSSRNIAYGTFNVTVSQIRGGTASIFQLSGTATGPQAIEVTGSSGGALDPDIVVKIVRID